MILSDNGTQFVGAQKEMKELVSQWSKDKLKEFCAERQSEWRFITPLAPHHGCAESLVKSCKRALKLATGEQNLKALELQTVLKEAENLVNERPIGRHGNDPDDGSYICPNDILLGRSSSRIPQGPFRNNGNPRDRVEFVQQIVKSFWKNWIKDVYPTLVPRKKWRHEKRNVRVGDIVVVDDPNQVRGKWTLGKITVVYPGEDTRVRSVKVKTQFRGQ